MSGFTATPEKLPFLPREVCVSACSALTWKSCLCQIWVNCKLSYKVQQEQPLEIKSKACGKMGLVSLPFWRMAQGSLRERDGATGCVNLGRLALSTLVSSSGEIILELSFYI